MLDMENEKKIQPPVRNRKKGTPPSMTADKAPADDQIEESGPGTAAVNLDHVQESEDLPESYGETRVMLLPVEPYLVHAYWEFSCRQILCLDEEQGKIKHRVNGDQKHTQPILRCYDVSDQAADWKNDAPYFDVNIDLATGNCYVPLFKAGKSYMVELGFKTRDGHFFAAAQSNTVETPRVEPVPEKEEPYSLTVSAKEEIEEYSPQMENHSDTLNAEDQPTASLKVKKRDVKEAVKLPGGPGDRFAEKAPHSNQFQEDMALDDQSIATSPQKTVHIRNKKNNFDLTEISEEKFAFGFSSK